MNTAITTRVLITHKLRWYWTISSLRVQIREISEGSRPDQPDEYVQLPPISEDDLLKVIAHVTKDEHLINVDQSPLTDKVGRHILPYTGVMAVFCLADNLMKSEVAAGFTEQELARLAGLRWLSARRLHAFTKRLTRINADNNPTYGMCVSDNEAQVYLVKPGRPNEQAINLATQTYTGDLPTVWREAVVTPTEIRFRNMPKLRM